MEGRKRKERPMEAIEEGTSWKKNLKAGNEGEGEG